MLNDCVSYYLLNVEVDPGVLYMLYMYAICMRDFPSSYKSLSSQFKINLHSSFSYYSIQKTDTDFIFLNRFFLLLTKFELGY
jgi:hypothetical protein